ncbi:large ribosomal subunit protein bL20m-like [Amphiura filiformis]|uniref:large ribosomal subunit protein bL20m-like n=1 Tax=Amphiura filiformis TaxID=82378 RepID=UPI003B2150E1
MVHLSIIRYIRVPNPDKWWKRKFVFDQTGHFYGRRKNCYKIAIVALRKAWKDMQKSRYQNRTMTMRLFNLRIAAATVEHGMKYSDFIGNLPKHNIMIDRKILMQLATTEPKTFKCLVDLARVKQEEAMIEQYRQHPETLNKMTTQDDLLSEAMAKLSMNKSNEQLNDGEQTSQVSQTGKETAV